MKANDLSDPIWLTPSWLSLKFGWRMETNDLSDLVLDTVDAQLA